MAGSTRWVWRARRHATTSSSVIGRARHCWFERVNSWTTSQPLSAPRLIALARPPAIDV
jgi:hypothetical protein